MFNGRAKSEKMRVCTCQAKGCSAGKDPYGVGHMQEKGVLISHTAFVAHQKAEHRMEVLKRVELLRPDPMYMVNQNGIPSPPCLSGSPDSSNTPRPSRYQAFRSPDLRQISSHQRLSNQPSNSTNTAVTVCESALDENVDMADPAAEIVKIDTSGLF